MKRTTTWKKILLLLLTITAIIFSATFEQGKNSNLAANLIAISLMILPFQLIDIFVKAKRDME